MQHMTGMDGRVQGAVLFKDQSQTRQLWRCHCKKKAKTWTQMQVAERFKKKENLMSILVIMYIIRYTSL